MDKDAFNLEAYKSIRDEINRRIDIHYKIITTKYAFVGILLAFSLTSLADLRIGFSPFVVAAALAFLLDVVILENLGWIRNAGHFIRTRVENTPLSIVRWEGQGAQTGGKWNCFTVRGYILGSWIIGPIIYSGSFIDGLDYRNSVQVVANAACAYLLIYSLYLVFAHLGVRKAMAAEPEMGSAIVDPGSRRTADALPRPQTVLGVPGQAYGEAEADEQATS